MNSTVTIHTPRSGISALMCPTCKELARSRPKGASKFYGTLFVPLTLRQRAYIECGHTLVQEVACHQLNHTTNVVIQSLRG
jgi:hypothetical protein